MRQTSSAVVAMAAGEQGVGSLRIARDADRLDLPGPQQNQYRQLRFPQKARG